MRIRVKGNGHNIHIPVPTGLIFSKPSVWLYLKLARNFSIGAKKYIPENIEVNVDTYLTKISDDAVYALCAEIMRIKKRHGSWDLVEVHSADGQEVYITL